MFETAKTADLQSHPVSRAIFGLRAKLLRSASKPPGPSGIVAQTTALGWVVLAHRPGRQLVMGAVTQPWKAGVRFRAVPAEEFFDFDEPDLVKIVWTLEVERLGPASTRFRTETRAVATDDRARRRFRWYWRLVRVGVVAIRWVMLSVVRREAERLYREGEWPKIRGRATAAMRRVGRWRGRRPV